MKRVYNCYESLDVGYFPHCCSQTLSTLLRMNGLQINSYQTLLLGLESLFGFTVIEGLYQIPYGIIKITSQNFEKKVLDTLKIQYTYSASDVRKEDLITDIESGYCNRIYVIDPDYVLHNKSYEKIHVGGLTTCIVVGYDEKDIYLNSMAGIEKYCRVSFERFDKGRRIQVLPKEPENKSYIIDFVGYKFTDYQDNLLGYLNYNVEDIIRKFDYGMKKVKTKIGNITIHSYYGLEAYDELIKYLTQIQRISNALGEHMGKKMTQIVLSMLLKGIASGTVSAMRDEIGESAYYVSQQIATKKELYLKVSNTMKQSALLWHEIACEIQRTINGEITFTGWDNLLYKIDNIRSVETQNILNLSKAL